MSFIKIVDENEKWILNMTSTLFCVITITFSRVFSDEMIVCDNISFFVFLIYFAISKSCFEKFSEACIAVLKLFFLYYFMILFFRSQILTYVCHSQKMRHSHFKRLIFLIMLMHFQDHFDFVLSWNFVQNVNRFAASFNVCNNFVM